MTENDIEWVFVMTIERIIQENFDKFRLWIVEKSIKIARAPNDLKMTLNARRPKIPHIHVCWATTQESQFTLHFALRSLDFQIIEFLISS